MRVLWVVTLISLHFDGCAFLRRENHAGGDLNRVATALAADIANLDVARTIAFVGTRGPDGRQTPETKVLDRFLIAALAAADFSGVVDAGRAKETWSEHELVTMALDAQPGITRLLGVRLHLDEHWAYAQLILVDREAGAMRPAAVRRVPRKSLERLARPAPGPENARPLDIELHVLGVRREGGLAEQVGVRDGAELVRGDQLQIRFRVGVDCDVYAFLLGAQGKVQEIFTKQFVYGGRMQYGPSEDSWISLDDSEAEYTLYFIAAERLEDSGEGMFLAAGEFLREGADEMTQWRRVDETIGVFLLGGEPGASALARTGKAAGKVERFLLLDGTILESRGEALRGTVGVGRAMRFSVR